MSKSAKKKTAAKQKTVTAKTEASAKVRFDVGMDTETMKSSILNHLQYTLARHPESALPDEWWIATCLAVRDRILNRFMKTQEVHHKQKVRRAYYLSLEYLMGRLLLNSTLTPPAVNPHPPGG